MADNAYYGALLRRRPHRGLRGSSLFPEITADNFELKHGLLTLVQNKQFFGHDKEDPHAHIRYFNKITSTMKFPNVPRCISTLARVLNDLSAEEKKRNDMESQLYDDLTLHVKSTEETIHVILCRLRRNKARFKGRQSVVPDCRGIGRYNVNNQGRLFRETMQEKCCSWELLGARECPRHKATSGFQDTARKDATNASQEIGVSTDHIFKADQCDAFVSDVDEAPNIQTMFMNKVAIGYKNPLYLTRAKQAQSALYNGHVLVTTNHTPTVVHDSEDTREIAEITRKRMLLKMQSPLCVENKVKIAPPNYLKENFAPQRDLTPEQIFWSIDVNDRKKAETSVPKPLSALTVFTAHTSTNEQTYSSALTHIEDLKAQLEGNLKVATRSSVKPKVLAPGMEIVEEARVVKPLDNALNYACQYTKLSQELLEYVIGTCPKSFNEKITSPSTPVTRKKQVTFNDKPGTSSSNTQKHEVHQKVQQTNVPVIHSTRVNTSTEA
ncbi:hypothetical protein Tco_0487051 [Tanacetum coccineum]